MVYLDEIEKVVEHYTSNQSTKWNFGNQIMYDMCAKNPYHTDADIIGGKIWIIGRTYAAAIERGKSNTEKSDDFY